MQALERPLLTVRNWNYVVAVLAALALFLPGFSAAQSGDEELLPQEQAFAFSASLLPDNRLEALWKIAPGYYMYRDKFSFSLEGETSLAAPAKLPAGKQKYDELFGEVEVYEDELRITLELDSENPSGTFYLVAGGQGCNEPVGVCYPPMKHNIAFDLGDLESNSSLANMSLANNTVETATALGSFSQRIAQNLTSNSNLGVSANESYSEVTQLAQAESSSFDPAPDIFASDSIYDRIQKNLAADDIDTGSIYDTANKSIEAAQTTQSVTAPLDDSKNNSTNSSSILGTSQTPGNALSRQVIQNLAPKNNVNILDLTQVEAESPEASKELADPESISALRDLLSAGFDQPEYLAVEDAFQLTMAKSGSDAVNVKFNVADGYYLYKKQMKFSANGTTIESLSLPEGEIKHDEYFGESLVFRNFFDFPVSVQENLRSNGKVLLEATYQGCADDGICYPPVTESAEFSFPSLISDASAQTFSDRSDPPSSWRQTLSTLFSFSGADKGTFLGLMVGALFAGLLLTFTPCVLPLIPILSSVIAGQGESITRAKGGFLAVIYVLGTAVTYAGMGALAGATGDQLQAYFQNIWAIGALALIFFIMALSMFGVFEIQLPSSLQSRLQSGTTNLSGAVIPVFILGLVSALIVGACVSPVLISFLSVAVSQADPYLGAQLMFMMALGMGIPLIALGFGAGYIIPRAGRWMESIKHLFGIMLIGVGIYMLGVLPEVPVLLLWGVFFIILSVYLGATQSLPEGRSGWITFQKGLGTVLLIWGVFALVGGFFGERDLISPIPKNIFYANSNNGPSTHEAAENIFARVSSPEALTAELTNAKNSNKKVIIDFYADWCVDCIKMEKATFSDRVVAGELESEYVALQIDVTDPSDPGTSAIKKQLGVFGPPAVLFFDTQGDRRKEKDFYGFKKPDEFLALLTAP